MRIVIVNLLLISWAALGQQQQTKPVFETASIKPADPQETSSSWNTNPGLIRAVNLSLKSYIMVAYDVKAYQVTGATGWMDSQKYDIVARLEKMSDEGLPGKDTPRLRGLAEDARIRTAMQALLAERFQLKFHRESKMMPAYALSIAKSGFKLKEVPAGNGSGMNSNGNATSRKLTATRANMDRLVSFLANQMGQPVANLTHIEGFFDFTLEWTPDELRNGGASDGPALPSIFTALQEQLGLKLETQKAPVEIIVVDSAERPTEN